MRKIFEKFIRQCNEDFVEEYPMDAVDVCILDNFVDYVVDRLEIIEMIKNRYEELKARLFNKKECGWENLREEEKTRIDTFGNEYIYFLNKFECDSKFRD